MIETPFNDQLSILVEEIEDLKKQEDTIKIAIRNRRKKLDKFKEDNSKVLTKERRLFNTHWFREWQRLIKTGETEIKDWRELEEPKKKKFI